MVHFIFKITKNLSNSSNLVILKEMLYSIIQKRETKKLTLFFSGEAILSLIKLSNLLESLKSIKNTEILEDICVFVNFNHYSAIFGSDLSNFQENAKSLNNFYFKFLNQDEFCIELANIYDIPNGKVISL